MPKGARSVSHQGGRRPFQGPHHPALHGGRGYRHTPWFDGRGSVPPRSTRRRGDWTLGSGEHQRLRAGSRSARPRRTGRRRDTEHGDGRPSEVGRDGKASVRECTPAAQRALAGAVPQRSTGAWSSAPHTFKTKGDAARWLASVEADKARGIWLDPSAGRISLSEYATAWLRGKATIAPRTREIYELQLRRHILPAISPMASRSGSVPLERADARTDPSLVRGAGR